MRRYQQVFSILPARTIDSLFRDGLVPGGAGDEILKCWDDLGTLIESVDELTGFSFLEIRSALPDELLMYTDKISMHHSLEARVPYLDHEIIEYVERLPAAFKVRKGEQEVDRWEWKADGGMTGTLVINDEPYILDEGSLFLVSTKKGNVRLKQLDKDLSALMGIPSDRFVESLQALAKSDKEIGGFFVDASGGNRP